MSSLRTRRYCVNEHQIHKSAYYNENFRRRGYKVGNIQMQHLPRIIRIFEYIYRRLGDRYAIKNGSSHVKLREPEVHETKSMRL